MIPRMIVGVAFVALLMGSLAPVASAQDSHYWSNAYGTRSAFMGGAVVGGVNDTSAGFYNPGALGFVDHPSLSVSADAIRLTDLHIDNGVGGAGELDSEEVEVIPLLVSGIVRFDALSDRHSFGYSFLSRNNHRMKVSARREASEDVLTNPLAPGPESFIGQFTRNDQLVEIWGGASYAYRYSEHVAIGVTNFLALRSQDLNQTTFARAINQNQGVSGATDSTLFLDYWNTRLLWKLGVALQYPAWRAGLAITTPSVNLLGHGTVGADFTVSNVDIDGDGSPDTFVGDDRQEDLESEFRTPLSIAAGIEFEVSAATRVGLSAEWFASQSSHTVMAPESKAFTRSIGEFPATDSRDLLRVTHGGAEVFNMGIGIEHDFSETLRGYFAFRTDHTYLEDDPGDGIPLGFSGWDLYHTTLGVNIKRESSVLGLGMVYSYGSRDDFPQLENFSSPEEAGFLTGVPGDAEARYQALTFLLGGTFYFR